MCADTEHPTTICPSCGTQFSLENPKFCPYCRTALKEQTLTGSTLDESITLIQEHFPDKKIQFAIGPYQILDTIGKGGMGEVFLAYDTLCGRRIALKRIRPDLLSHVQLQHRFLREARITSQLTHPTIIPIYSIQSEEHLSYYTMPYVEGKTLKQLFSEARKQEKKGLKPDHATTIPALMRIFLSVCQAVAYAHSKGVIHRDLKPNNIILGRYGEVLILDWGLAKLMTNIQPPFTEEPLDDKNEATPAHDLTHIGKVVGTVAYMAPERAKGTPATFQTDIYSLGVILYQILTLQYPFHRSTLLEFRKRMDKEVLQDPAEIAPYRDVPPVLAGVAAKCLSPNLEERYQTVEQMIHDVESYIEGRSEWFKTASLSIYRKEDWEFQENVLIAEYIAITRGAEVSDWVSLMISKTSFVGNIRLESRVCVHREGHGIGFLISIPEPTERVHLNSGYCLWLASENTGSTKLLHSAVEVIYAPEVVLKQDVWYDIRIEKVEHNISIYLNDQLQFSYISHLPLSGTHVGIIARDANFTLDEIIVSVGSQNITVNCLAVPDAFLAHKQYAIALQEYRRIANAFPGTAEGREALFRAGVTLMEESRTASNKNKKTEEALEEFGKLHQTPGAPLEYLGKALVYQSLGDHEEEIKCFELALRRYPHHPLLSVIREQLVHRLHEVSRFNRMATYDFLLLAIRFLPGFSNSPTGQKLFKSLKNHWEPLYFMEEETLPHPLPDYSIAIPLAFWLAKPYVLLEIIEQLLSLPTLHVPTIANAVFALIELHAWDIVEEAMQKIENHPSLEQITSQLDSLRYVIKFHKGQKSTLPHIPKRLRTPEIRMILAIMSEAISNDRPQEIHKLATTLSSHDMTLDTRLHIDCFRIWAYLLQNDWKNAGDLLQTYSVEQLTQENSPLHMLYGCWLYVTEGKEIASIHFSSLLDVSYPRTWALLSHFIERSEEELQNWLIKAFVYEKRQLYRQLALFSHCIGDRAKSQYYKGLND